MSYSVYIYIRYIYIERERDMYICTWTSKVCKNQCLLGVSTCFGPLVYILWGSMYVCMDGCMYVILYMYIYIHT